MREWIWFMIVVVIMMTAASALPQRTAKQGIWLSQLRSDDWQQRAAAVEKLIAHGTALKSEEVRKALIDLLDRENRLIEATWRESGGQEGV